MTLKVERLSSLFPGSDNYNPDAEDFQLETQTAESDLILLMLPAHITAELALYNNLPTRLNGGEPKRPVFRS